MNSPLNDEQKTSITQLFSAKGKIAAVKLHMDLTGYSLRDAKLEVEQLVARGTPHSTANDLNDDLMDLVLDAIQNGTKIEAIKYYRKASGKSLKASREFIETLMSELEIADPKAVGKSGCLLVLGIVMLGCVFALVS